MAHRDQAHCMSYVPSWDLNDPEDYLKLKRTHHGQEHVAYIPKASGVKGIEHLLNHTIDRFDQAKDTLNLTGQSLYNHFAECLLGNYSENWASVLDQYPQNQRTTANFPAAQRMLSSFIVGEGQKDTMFEYLQSDDFHKPEKVKPQDHLS